MPFLSLSLLAGLMLLWRRAERRGEPWSPSRIALALLLALAFPALWALLWALALDFVTPLAVLALIVWAASAHSTRARASARRARAVREALKRARRSSRHALLRGLLREAREGKRQARAERPAVPGADEGGAATRAVAALTREHGRAPAPDVALRLRELEERVREADTYLRERGLSESEPGRRLHLIAADYLPGALRAYSRLPRKVAESAPLFGGKTGKDVLLDQLGVLSRGVETLLADVATGEGQALLAHGRFLRGKFETARPDFDV